MAQGVKDNLEQFAKRITTRIRTATGNTDAIEMEFCRMFTSAETETRDKIQLMRMWSEWRYGKAKETHEIKHDIKVEMSISDADAIITGYLGSAAGRTIEVSQGDRSQAQEQAVNVLPGARSLPS